MNTFNRLCIALLMVIALTSVPGSWLQAQTPSQDGTPVAVPTLTTTPPVTANPVTTNSPTATNPTVALEGVVVRFPAVTYLNEQFNLVAHSHGNRLGVEVAPVEAPLRSQLNVAENVGVFVTSVTPESAAANAGLQPYDVLVDISDSVVANPEKFDELIGTMQGKEVKLKIFRQSKPMTLNVTIPSFQVYELAVGQPTTTLAYVTQRFRIGVSLAEADDVLRSQLRLASGEGLVVTEVIPESPATKAGILQHDVLVKLEGKRLSTVAAATDQIQEIKERQVMLALIRAGQEISVQVTPQASTEQLPVWEHPLTLSGTMQVLSLATPQRDLILYSQELNTGHVQFGIEAPVAPVAVGTPTDQIATIRKQLEEMGKALQALESSLKPESAPVPAKPQEEPKK